ncbi:hypothetical protein PM10SUCC1_14750 [Propionigenium maris DSM 9537]|uniref:Uncharacterized protein n=1 Tax=Propionigenium maris DSM 9537 TaxID=1123000 RepID=A0A9W6GLE6_9FUSO|nr:hypothetical protein [Propionigenium maris]GLI55961.1 hypothetical protein PM10SUCC1_14750 [Propionigenium maris DSM 9537]
MKKIILFLVLSLSLFTTSFATIKSFKLEEANVDKIIIGDIDTHHSGRTNSQG